MTAATADGGASQFVTTRDGLKLHVRTFGPWQTASPPVVCLPGLTRTIADFAVLARALASDPERPCRVVAIDSRGRGRSDYDPNPRNYNLATELGDLVTVITALDLDPAVFVGTSRGGILAMMLATARPTAMAGVVLNDIGPVIEVQGLARIKSYVGHLAKSTSFADAATILRRLFAAQFPTLTEDDWLAFAKRGFEEKAGRLVATYDTQIATLIERLDLGRPLPPLWAEFDALSALPVMVIRGANSDLLSAATVAAMCERRPDLLAIEIPDQGHAPLLAEAETIARIASFIRACERK